MVFSESEDNSSDSEDVLPYYHPPRGNVCCINILPDNILGEIFAVLYTFWPTQHHRRRTETRVCHRWRALIINSPQLWTRIYLPRPLTGPSFDNAISFERSKNALLDLTVRSGRESTDREEEQIKTTLVQHHTRLRSLTIQTGSEMSVSLILRNWWENASVRITTPNLKTMHMDLMFYRGAPRDRHTEYANPWEKKFDEMGVGSVRPWPGLYSLETLILDDFDVRKFPASEHLHTLRIGPIELTVKDMKDLVKRFPNLLELTIEDLLPLTTPGERVHPGTVIRAQALQRLGIGSSRKHSKGCDCGMAYLEAPEIKYLELQCDPSLINEQHLCSILDADCSPYLRTIRLGDRAARLEDDAIHFLRRVFRLPDINVQASWLVGPPGYNDGLKVLLHSVNARSVTIDFAFPHKFGWMRPKKPDAADVIEIIKKSPKKKSVNFYVRGLTEGGDELTYGEVETALRNSRVRLLRSPAPEWLIAKWNSFSSDPFNEESDEEDDEGDDEEDAY